MIAGCMLFDSRFSIEGWLCCKSIHQFDPTMKIYILCMDERVFGETSYWQQHYNAEIVPIRLYEFENHFKQLLGIRSTRPWNAYTITCKVFLPSYIFEKYGEHVVYFVDSDLYFWNSSMQIENVLGDYSFMVTTREQEPPPRQGRFNAGFFVCRNDKCATKFLTWWQERVIEWCLWEPGSMGKYGEEGYLNIFYENPRAFSGILVSSHPGINLAHWNMYKHNLILNNEKIVIDKEWPLICFHYQGMIFHKKRFESCVELKNEAVEHIYDTYYKKYLLFKEEFSNGMDSCRWW